MGFPQFHPPLPDQMLQLHPLFYALTIRIARCHIAAGMLAFCRTMRRPISVLLISLALSAPAGAQKMIKVNPDNRQGPLLSAPVKPLTERERPNPAPKPEPLDLSYLSLSETYRTLDMFRYVGRGATRGSALDALLRAFQAEQYDDDPNLTQNDYRLREGVRAASQRVQLRSQILRYDLDGDLVATEEELTVGARATVTRGRQTVVLTEDQLSGLVNEHLAKFLRYDANGDRDVTIAELDAWSEAKASGGNSSAPQNLSPEWDVDGDGRITEVELRRAADAALDLIDRDRDGLLAQQEIDLIRTSLIRRKGRVDNKARGRIVQCSLPRIPADTMIAVVQGRKGSGVTDLEIARDRSEVVRMSELVVPAGEKPIHVIASMRSSTVFRISGEGAHRVRGVTGVAAQVGLLPGSQASLSMTKCFSGFLGIRLQEPGGLRAEFERVLGRPVGVLVEAETLGQVDLGNGRNNVSARLTGDILGSLEGDANLVGEWLLSFDPGGYQEPDPKSVVAESAVTKLPVPPLEIGLMVLAMQEALEFVEGPGGRPVAILRTGDATDDKGASAKSASAPNRRVPARNMLHVVARRYFEMPPGYTDEFRALRVIVPDGVPRPKGIPGWAQTQR